MGSDMRLFVAIALLLAFVVNDWSVIGPPITVRVRAWWRRRQAAKARAHLRLINRAYNPRGEAMRAFARGK